MDVHIYETRRILLVIKLLMIMRSNPMLSVIVIIEFTTMYIFCTLGKKLQNSFVCTGLGNLLGIMRTVLEDKWNVRVM